MGLLPIFFDFNIDIYTIRKYVLYMTAAFPDQAHTFYA
jgi:hypothetical protein